MKKQDAGTGLTARRKNIHAAEPNTKNTKKRRNGHIMRTFVLFFTLAIPPSFYHDFSFPILLKTILARIKKTRTNSRRMAQSSIRCVCVNSKKLSASCGIMTPSCCNFNCNWLIFAVVPNPSILHRQIANQEISSVAPSSLKMRPENRICIYMIWSAILICMSSV